MDARIGLIQWLVGPEPCYISIGSRIGGDRKTWQDRSFAFPSEANDIEAYIDEHSKTSDLYFCPTALNARNRVKANVPYSWCLWADLDDCPPDKLRIPPSVVIQTSPNRHQAYWKLNGMCSPLDVEDMNRRIAYAHKDDGCDVSGWDLTQMMRVPMTYNFKHMPPPQIKLVEFFQDRLYDLKDFDATYPIIAHVKSTNKQRPLPKKLPSETANEILEALDNSLHPRVWRLFTSTPDHDWSRSMWDLELSLFGVGATPEQVLIVLREAACNKFARDGLGDEVLWKEVLRAQAFYNQKGYTASPEGTKVVRSDKPIISDDEMDIAMKYGTFIDQYQEWGSQASDAPPSYHIGGALVILSALLANKIKLDTSFGAIIPNVWVMLVADTTLTRKSTTMDMAMDALIEVMPEALMATDGSVEGIMQAMSTRPGVSSVFLRDEFSGMLESMSKKDYMAGFMEMLTKLYDNKPYRRQLKRETIQVDNPVFILYAGGVKEKLYTLIQPHHISSGFFPRFLFIIADADFNRIRPLGPPTEETAHGRIAIMDRIRDIANAYTVPTGSNSMFIDPYKKIELTPNAWRRYNIAEETMQQIGYNSGMDDMLTPMMTRLAITTIKIAALIAGSEQLGTEFVCVDEIHIVKALAYAETFKEHAIQVVNNTGHSTTERLLNRVLIAVNESPDGLARSLIMQRHSLMARDATIIIDTLKDRGLVREDKINGVRMIRKA